MLGKDRDGTEQTHELEDRAKEDNVAGSLPSYQKLWAGWLIGQAPSFRVATQVAGSQQGKFILSRGGSQPWCLAENQKVMDT